MELPFEFGAGSVVGADHTHARKPNQDAYHLLRQGEMQIGVVCDGCGDPSSPHSEVGAKLGARLVASCIACEPFVGGNLDFARISVLTAIDMNVMYMARQSIVRPTAEEEQKIRRDIIRDYFLFTIVGFILTRETATFFSIGDGTLYVNGERLPLGPFPNNAPPYLSYALLDSSLLTNDPGSLDFRILREMPTDELESFLIGSDGVQEIERRQAELMPNQKSYLGGVAQFWTDGKYFQNSQSVNRKLALANTPHQEITWEDRQIHRYPGLLYDDTTLIVGRRRFDAREHPTQPVPGV